jgi:hypothetical protein
MTGSVIAQAAATGSAFVSTSGIAGYPIEPAATSIQKS